MSEIINASILHNNGEPEITIGLNKDQFIIKRETNSVKITDTNGNLLLTPETLGAASTSDLTAASTAANKYTDAKISAIPTPDVSGQISVHDTNDKSHQDIRLAIESSLTEANKYTDDKIIAIPTPDVSGQIDAHDKNDKAHESIRKSIEDSLKEANEYTDAAKNKITKNVQDLEVLVDKNQDVIRGLEDTVTTKANIADIATTKYIEISNSSVSYAKIGNFGNWGSDELHQCGFSMIISSKGGEQIWISLFADDTNKKARACRLSNVYSKINNIYYSISESAIYVELAELCNDISVHILSNINGKYVPTIEETSSVSNDAINIKIIEFGPADTGLIIGDSSTKLVLGGSAERPEYNSKDLALKSDVDLLQEQFDALASSAITIHSGTEVPSNNMGEDGDLYVYTGGE